MSYKRVEENDLRELALRAQEMQIDFTNMPASDDVFVFSAEPKSPRNNVASRVPKAPKRKPRQSRSRSVDGRRVVSDLWELNPNHNNLQHLLKMKRKAIDLERQKHFL
jgi:hypothetical protein